MFQILVNKTIRITRGDTAYISLTIYSDIKNKVAYELKDGDIVKFTIKKSVHDNVGLVEKIFIDNEIKIDPNDTKPLDFGKHVYDVQLVFANGDINTIIPSSIFEVMGEVSE